MNELLPDPNKSDQQSQVERIAGTDRYPIVAFFDTPEIAARKYRKSYRQLQEGISNASLGRAGYRKQLEVAVKTDPKAREHYVKFGKGIMNERLSRHRGRGYIWRSILEEQAVTDSEAKYGLPDYSRQADTTPEKYPDEDSYRKLLESERVVIAEMMKADKLTVICRNFVYPEWNRIGVLLVERGSFSGLPVVRLFKHLGKTEEQLREVYVHVTPRAIHRKDSAARVGYVGEFTENGRQRLADHVGKPVHYRYQESSAPILKLDLDDDPNLDESTKNLYRRMYPEWGVYLPRTI